MGKLIFILLVVFIIIAVIGPFLVQYNPLEIDLNKTLQPPSFIHLFGTDNQGRDVLSPDDSVGTPTTKFVGAGYI